MDTQRDDKSSHAEPSLAFCAQQQSWTKGRRVTFGSIRLDWNFAPTKIFIASYLFYSRSHESDSVSRLRSTRDKSSRSCSQTPRAMIKNRKNERRKCNRADFEKFIPLERSDFDFFFCFPFFFFIKIVCKYNRRTRPDSAFAPISYI